MVRSGILLRLVQPHPRLTTEADRLGARLFAALMLVHIVVVLASFAALNLHFYMRAGDTVWDDVDAWVILGGVALIAASYRLLKAGFFRPAVIAYIVVTAAVALAVPFSPDPNAEIGLLASAIIPVLLAAIVLSTRAVVAVLLSMISAGSLGLAFVEIPADKANTGLALLIVVAVTGALILVFRTHMARLERLRLDELRRSETTAREKERRYLELFETVTDGIFLLDPRGQFVEVNNAACRQLGYSRDELLALSLPDITPEPEEGFTALMQSLQQKGSAFFEAEHLRKDGAIVPVELSVTSVTFEGRPAFLGVARDLTERRRVEDERRRLEEQLQHAVKLESVGLLAGGVAHDFNNLLTAILVNAELEQAQLPADSKLRGSLQVIMDAAESAASLTRQLLAFSSRQVIEPRAIELNELIQRLHKMLIRIIGEDIHLETLPGEGLGAIKADPGIVEQIIVNLVVNARDAMPHGGTLIIETANVVLEQSYAATHATAEMGDYVVLAITDTGTGMSPEVRSRIFEPFFTTKAAGRGTGLGLATVYGAVKQSNGHIEVYSEIGQGTTFRIYLPRVYETPEQAVRGELVRRGGDETLLVVEDEALVRDVAARVLEQLGYRVLVATNGAEAIDLARAHQEPIHLLLTDVVMPGMNGRDLADQLAAIHPETRVLFCSGYTANIIAHRGVLDKGVDFIGKPYTPLALGAKVREVLDRAPAPGEAPSQGGVVPVLG